VERSIFDHAHFQHLHSLFSVVITALVTSTKFSNVDPG